MQPGSEETIGHAWHWPRSLLATCLVLGVASASVFAEVSGRTQPWKMGCGAGLPPVRPSGAPHPAQGRSGASTRAPHPLGPSSSSFQLQELGSCLGWLCAARSHERSGAEMSEGGSSPCPMLRAQCALCAFAGEPLPPAPWGGDGRGGDANLCCCCCWEARRSLQEAASC